MSSLLCACWVTVAGAVGCDPGYNISLVQDAGTAGPNGVTIPLTIESTDTPGGVAVSVSAVPSTVSVSPATVSIKSGTAGVYALVPYGTTGTVLGSAAFATTASTTVTAAPLILCSPTFTPSNNGADVTAAGQGYIASIPVIQSGACGSGTPAPSGVALSMMVTQPTGTPTTEALAVGAGGVATGAITVPWGGTVSIQVSGGGAAVAGVVTGTASPVTLLCMTWNQNPTGVYAVSTEAVNGKALADAIPVAFSVAAPFAAAGVINPPSIMSDEKGVAVTYVTVPDAGSLPVVIEAATGSFTTATELTTSATGGGCL